MTETGPATRVTASGVAPAGEDHGLLALLADGGFHSGESLAVRLGISRAAVWKRIGRLAELGLDVERRSGRGYRLAGGIELLEHARILAALGAPTRARLPRLELRGVVGSTNDVLLQALRAHTAEPGVVCLAERQTAGRGRRGRRWSSPFGSNIYLSLAWRFERGVAALEGLSLAIGVAVVRALVACGIEGVGLKWPTDLVAGGAKLGGILIELEGELAGPVDAVIGIGVNVRMPRAGAAVIDQPWTDLETLAGRAVSRNDFAAALIDACYVLLPEFAARGFAALREDWQRLDVLAGRAVTVTAGDGGTLAGTAEGVDASGALRLRTAEGLRALSGGEVSVRRAG